MHQSALTPVGQPREKQKPRNGFYRGTTLAIAAFSSGFYSRIFCSITRAPSALNHFHFVAVPFTTAIILATAKPKDRKQIATVQLLLFGLFALFTTMVASAFLNSAGLVNAVFSFLILGGPFMLLTSIACLPMSPESFGRFRQWIIKSSFANMILAFVQWPLLKFGKISAGGLDETDGMAGVFFVSGAGNYVSATVSVFFGIYYLMFAKAAPLWLRVGTILAAFFQLQLSDSKQIIFALFSGAVLLVLCTMKDVGKALTYTIGIILLIAAFYWCIQNVEAFSAFKNYVNKGGVWGPDGEAARIKPIAFRIIPSYFESPLNWLLGLGPGHTVGRLGGWLLKENWGILGPLGATQHPASDAVLTEYYNSWLAMESTMFCPMFGWAGIWGDIGFAGLGAYLFLCWIAWRNLCFDNFSKFLMLSTAVLGFIFTQLEEPGHMLYTASLTGLHWQERRAEKLQQEARNRLISSSDDELLSSRAE
jgi:hypothetical protein